MSLLQDLRFAWRLMWKSPGFTAVAVMALALGIGSNSVMFTVTNAILLKSLPFSHPEQIVHVGCNNLAKAREGLGASYLDFQDWRAQSRSFHGLAAFASGTMNVSDEGGVPERFSGAWVTANTFGVVGQATAAGRDFAVEEDLRGVQPVVILGNGIWQNRYGGDPGILGKTIRVNAVLATVIGVMPAGMNFPINAEIWMPLAQSKEREKRDLRDLAVFGRLDDGVSIGQARTELNGIAGRLAQEYPKTNEGISATVMTFNEKYNAPRFKLALEIMMGAVGFVLMIACANVANLLLSRAAYRAREISIRAAIGAGRWRIVGQLLIESLLLAFMGGALGLGLSVVGMRMIDRSLSAVEGKPYWVVFTMDWKVFAFFIGVCLVTSLLFGLTPALKATKADLVEALKDSGHGGGSGFKPRRLSGTLVTVEIALTLVLLSGAGLMIRDFLRSQKIYVGASPGNLLTMRLRLPEDKYKTADERTAFQEQLSQRLQAIPGIGSTSLTSNLPIGGSMTKGLEIHGQPVDDKEKFPQIGVLSVSPGYFETLGVNLLRGRTLRADDGKRGSEVAVINDRFANKYWPGSDPLGRRIRLSSEPDAPWLSVVGVSQHIYQSWDNKADSDSIVYIPYRQEPVRTFCVMVRSIAPSASLVQTVRREVQALDPDLPLYWIRTMDEHLSQSMWPYRTFGSLFVIFGLIALLLSAMGIYSVTAYSVSQRTHEIGIRVALGAEKSDVLRLVLRQGIGQLLIGTLLGLTGALTVGRVLERVLVQTKASDPVTVIAISVILGITAVMGCAIPAMRAARLHPTAALGDRQ